MAEINFHFPVILSQEGKWHVAACPMLDIATQGKTIEEARENIKELIEEYLKDPDTVKPDLSRISYPFLTSIPVKVPFHIYGKTSPLAAA